MFTASSVHSPITEAPTMRVLPRAPVCALVNVCARSRKREERGCGPFYLIKRCPLGGEWGCWLSGQRKVPRTTQHALQPAQHKYTNTFERRERSARRTADRARAYTHSLARIMSPDCFPHTLIQNRASHKTACIPRWAFCVDNGTEGIRLLYRHTYAEVYREGHARVKKNQHTSPQNAMEYIASQSRPTLR